MIYVAYYLFGLGCAAMTVSLIKSSCQGTDETSLFFAGVFIIWIGTWLS